MLSEDKEGERQYCYLCKQKVLAHTACLVCGKDICIKHGKPIRGADGDWMGYCCDQCQKGQLEKVELEKMKEKKRNEEWDEKEKEREKKSEQWIKELKPKLTDEFLDIFILAAKASQWKKDYVEYIDDFVEFIFEIAEKKLPDELDL